MSHSTIMATLSNRSSPKYITRPTRSLFSLKLTFPHLKSLGKKTTIVRSKVLNRKMTVLPKPIWMSLIGFAMKSTRKAIDMTIYQCWSHSNKRWQRRTWRILVRRLHNRANNSCNHRYVKLQWLSQRRNLTHHWNSKKHTTQWNNSYQAQSNSWIFNFQKSKKAWPSQKTK